MNTKIIKFDINKNLYDTLLAKQGDTKSRFLLFNLLDGSIPFSLENRSVRVYAIKPDKTEVFNDLIITDAAKGYCVLELTTQMLAVAGTVKLELMVIEEDKKLTSNVFYMDVKESINSEKAVVSTNEFGALLTALQDVDNWNKEFTEKSGKLEELYTPRLNELGSQLEHIESFYLKLRNYIRYGEIILPDDFTNNINFKLYRDLDGIIKHTAKLNYFESGINIYVASVNGSDNNDGLTSSTPLRSLTKAFEICEARSETHFIINLTYDIFWRNYSGAIASSRTLTKNYKLLGLENEGTYLGTFEKDLVFTLENGVYKTARSGVEMVMDKLNKCFDGTPNIYTKMETLDECKIKKGSWYTDGSILYVNTIDNRTPDSGLLVTLNTGAFNINLSNDTIFYCENINFAGHHQGSPNLQIINAYNKGFVIMNNCNILGSSYGNGFSVSGIKYTWLFNCISKNSFRDGFNYHNYINGKECFVFEYNCTAYDCGLLSPNGNNNATTCHDGIRILRIGAKGWNTKGPVLADVNACYSINYDCTMYDSTLLGGSTASAFFFSNDGEEEKGKFYLYNCEGGGYKTYSINTYDDAIINVCNFRGYNFPQPNNNFPQPNIINFID